MQAEFQRRKGRCCIQINFNYIIKAFFTGRPVDGRGILIQNICYQIPVDQIIFTAAGKVDTIINDPVIISRISLISRTFPFASEKSPVYRFMEIRKKLIIHRVGCRKPG